MRPEPILAALATGPRTLAELVAILGRREALLRTLRQLTATPYVCGPDADQRYRICDSC